MQPMLFRAVGYRRVSMREQVDGYSLDAQENHIRQYVEAQGWLWAGIYTDAGISAKKDSHRPELERLMQDAGQGKFEVVVVDKIDRFYRHLAGLLTALDQLNKYGVTFVSVQERLDFATPWGKLTLTVLGMLAEIYISNLRQETRKGKRQRARDGLWNGNIPYGYCKGLCSHCKDPNGPGYCPNIGQPDQSDGKRLIAHPVDGPIVRYVFDWYASGETSDGKIAEWLNHHIVTLPGGSQLALHHRSTLGQESADGFGRDNIRGLLTRHFYTGKIAYRGVDEYGNRNKRKPPTEVYPGQHPALVDDATFEKVQEMRNVLTTNPKYKGSKSVRIYPLTGMLRCGYCGALFRGSSHHDKHYYRDASQLDRTHDCSQPLLGAEDIENQVLALLESILAAVPAHISPDELEAQKEQSDTRMARARELYLLREIDRDAYEAEKDRHEIALQGLHYPESSAIIALTTTIQQVIAGWGRILPIERKKALRLSLEGLYARENALVGWVPSKAFLPLVQSLGLPQEGDCCSCGPDEVGVILK